MTAHETILRLAVAAIDFEPSTADRRRVAEHVAGCPVCRRTIAALRADAHAFGSLPRTRMPDDRAAAVLARVLRRRPWLEPLRLALVAALLALLALGSILVGAELIRRANDEFAVVPPAPVTASPSAPAPSTSPVWARADVSGVSLPLTGAAAGGAAFLAFGNDFGCGEPCMLPVIASASGGSWTTVPEQATLTSRPYAPTSGPMLGIVDAAWGPAGWVAIGYLADGTPGYVTLWRSSDGRTWERLADLAAFQQVDPKAVVGWAEGYLVVGTDWRETMDGVRTGHAYAAAWTSPDGRTWTRALDDPVLEVGGFSDTLEWPDYGGMTAVSRLTDGTFLAVGTVHGACRELFDGLTTTCDDQPLAWRSSDGLRWTRTAPLPVADGQAADVTATDDGGALILVRTQRSVGDSTVVETSLVRSADGAGWDVTAGPADPAETIAVAGGRTFVTGADGSSNLPPLWEQGDDGSWSRVALSGWTPTGYIQGAGLAVGPDAAVLVGARASDGGGWEPFAYIYR